MKMLLLSLFLLVTLSAFSQSQWEIELSHEMPVPRMGKWVKGDYTVYISLDTLARYFRICQQSTTKSLEYYENRDSNLVNYFKATQNRYCTAASQLEQAANDFDLKTLIIYEGMDNPKRNAEDFAILERYLEQRVQQGKAIVFFKGKRIYTLCRTSEMSYKVRSDTFQDILNQGYITRTFYDEPGNCLFFEYMHLGW